MDGRAVPSPFVAAAVDPNRALRTARTVNYPKYIWYIISSTITLITLCHWGSILYGTCVRCSRKKVDADEEGATLPPRGSIDLRRLPLAVVNLFRIIAFLWTLPIGFGSRLPVAEVIVLVGYMAGIIAWEFTNSE